ncbi:Serine/threonine-protein phosphatase 7 long form homolog [Linum grandiflorum]
MLHNLDYGLLEAFMERWQPDTNSFHLPFGEMTITLHDVRYILQVPIRGKCLRDGDQAGLRAKMASLLGLSEIDLDTVKSIKEYAWGAATLAWMYMELGLASRA